MGWAFWIVVGIAALAGEAMTMSLILASFALAAFVVAPLSLALPLAYQVVAFGAAALVLLFAVRPAALRLLPLSSTEQVWPESGPVGREAMVVERVDRHVGEVRLGRGQFWSARCAERGVVIEPGQEVEIVDLEGFTAIVRPLEPGAASAPIEGNAEQRSSPAAPHPILSLSPGEAPAEVRTFLIADIRGYTRFTQERGDEAAAKLAERFVEVARAGVGGHGGRVLETRGDEILAVFGSPRQALRAATEMQACFAEATAAEPGLPLMVGIGVDAGEAVPVADGYRGGALNLASRLCSVAAGGEVLASEEVAHLARKMEGLRYLDRGSMELKGLAEPVRVVQVVSECMK